MKILCKNCKSEFEYKGDPSAQIEYVKCQNVFKVVYATKILCPNCMTVLLPQSQGKEIIGVPIQEIAKSQKRSEGTKVTEETDYTRTRKSLLAKAFEEVKRNLRKEGSESETMKLEPIVPLEESTVKTSPSPSASVSKPSAKKTTSSVLKSLKAVYPKNGWHFKVSKKQAKLLKNFGLSILILGLASFFGQVLPEIFSGRSSYADSVHPETSYALIIDTKETPRTITDPNVDVINLEDLRKIFEAKMTEKTTPQTPKSERLSKPDDTSKKLNETISKLRLTSRFGYRSDPWSHERRFHAGIDIPRPYRAPIRAVLDGTVIYSGYKGGYGNLVILKHENGTKTYYGHNAKNIVLKGDKIARGEILGYVGMTGRTTGPHLHFEARKNNVPTNPIDFLRKVIKKVGKITI